ncbi:Na+/H+ antiporter [Azospirillum picis]|uniref:CPA1 family monovalent cation:H+ antiporter n=1 Tax=Azospirillum picis TaxID=488438 RepID=A0ABU0MPB2_9PROT|nr:Na+/H+ antiporter [Azospirillum picis]MBP2301834.1 CPA1 family monovalent cation:H+ antiporter [Azospirillum picis]MDQ0534991.1 CPA1 family monovalent cation:H+ antiporter [Azospirillum picis]
MSPSGQFELILGLMAAVIALELAAQRLRLPPSAVLVAGGIVLALVPGLPEITPDPDLTLLLFLPPLLFASAYFTVWSDFRANLRIILQLAVGAVAFTTLAVGVAAHMVMPSLPWAACFALGAILSPPDAVAAKAVLKGLPLPPRIVTLLEGESLVNDATGLVLVRIAVAAGMTGAFDAGEAAIDFVWLAGGGVLAGVAFGYGAALVLGRLRDVPLSIVAGFLAAWGSYLGGEALEVSGVLATVGCGLVMGQRQHDLFSALVRTHASAVWNVVVFVLESLVFIIIGLSLRGVLGRLAEAGTDLSDLLPVVAFVAVAMVLSRFAWIFTSTYVPRFLSPGLRRRDPYPSVAVPVIMSWAGMRGVVSLAVALSIPDGFPGRDVILATTWGGILISILLQGTTLAPLIRMMKLGGFTLERRATLSESEARIRMSQAALEAVRSRSSGTDGAERHPRLVEQYGHRARMAVRFHESQGMLLSDRQEHFAAVLAANRAARNEILSLHRSGRIHDTVLHRLEAELDLEELSAEQALAEGEAVG